MRFAYYKLISVKLLNDQDGLSRFDYQAMFCRSPIQTLNDLYTIFTFVSSNRR